MTSLTSQKAQMGKAWNVNFFLWLHSSGAALRSPSWKYGNITVICLTMCYFSWSVSINNCTEFQISYHCILHFLLPFKIKFEHTYKYIMLLLQYIERELNNLRVDSMVGTLWDTVNLYYSLFIQPKEIINVY